MYEIADTYLSFWFAMLREDTEPSKEVRVRAAPCDSAPVRAGSGTSDECSNRPPANTPPDSLPRRTPCRHVVGPWWQDEVAEIDVLGVSNGGTRLIGAAARQAKQFDAARELTKLSHLPEPDSDLRLACGAAAARPRT